MSFFFFKVVLARHESNDLMMKTLKTHIKRQGTKHFKVYLHVEIFFENNISFDWTFEVYIKSFKKSLIIICYRTYHLTKFQEILLFLPAND